MDDSLLFLICIILGAGIPTLFFAVSLLLKLREEKREFKEEIKQLREHQSERERNISSIKEDINKMRIENKKFLKDNSLH